jgi:glucose-1-phosphate thymidylyltransferase
VKGIVLAGGSGSRLYPVTHSISKQLIPVYDKPMIYYPLSVLMLAGINEILIITTITDLPNFERLLGSGEELGIQLEYATQENPNGIAEAFILGEKFIGKDSVSLILGDNIFYGFGFTDILRSVMQIPSGATIFAHKVNDPERFGVVELNPLGDPISLTEKPVVATSNLAVTGLYFYDNSVIARAKDIVPSKRGELEITDINQSYLEDGLLNVQILGRGFAWLDTGTTRSLMDASHFIASIEMRQGLKIACLEEIAYQNGWISIDELLIAANKNKKTEYGQYILEIAKGKIKNEG